MASAGAIVGPLVALALIGHFGMRGVFWAASVPGALCVTVAIAGIRETRLHSSAGRLAVATTESNRTDAPVAPDPRTETAGPGVAPQFKLPGAFYYVLTVVAFFLLGNSSDIVLVLRGENSGIAASRAPLLGLVFNVMYTLLSWPAGKFSDRFSRSTIAAAG